jgi:hypothetical protein
MGSIKRLRANRYHPIPFSKSALETIQTTQPPSLAAKRNAARAVEVVDAWDAAWIGQKMP